MLQEWKQIVVQHLKGALEPHGFVKKGSVFGRDSDDVRLIVAPQWSRSSTQSLLELAVNLAVQSVILTKLRYSRGTLPWKDWCHDWWTRLSESPRSDQWWVATSTSEAHRIGSEIAHLLETRGLPWLWERSTTERLYWLWRNFTRRVKPCGEATSECIALLKHLYEPALLDPSPVEQQVIGTVASTLRAEGFVSGEQVYVKEMEGSLLLVELLSAPASLRAYNVFVLAGLQYQSASVDASGDVARPARLNEADVGERLINRDAPPYHSDWLVSTEDEAVAAGTAIAEQLQQEVLPLFKSIDTLPKLLRYYQDVYLPADIGYKPIGIRPHMEKVLRRMLDKG